MMRRGALSATATVGDVLRWVAGRRESGGLFVEGTENAVSGAAYLVDGDIAFVTTGHGLPMEQQFLAAGVLTREQLPAVMAQVHAGRDLAFVLDAEPGVEFRGVVQVIHDRSVEALGKLLGVTSGTYLLDRYQQHPFGMLGHWSAGPMIDLAERKYRVGQLDPGTAGLLGLVPQPTAGTDGDRDVVLSPVSSGAAGLPGGASAGRCRRSGRPRAASGPAAGQGPGRPGSARVRHRPHVPTGRRGGRDGGGADHRRDQPRSRADRVGLSPVSGAGGVWERVKSAA